MFLSDLPTDFQELSFTSPQRCKNRHRFYLLLHFDPAVVIAVTRTAHAKLQKTKCPHQRTDAGISVKRDRMLQRLTCADRAWRSDRDSDSDPCSSGRQAGSCGD